MRGNDLGEQGEPSLGYREDYLDEIRQSKNSWPRAMEKSGDSSCEGAKDKSKSSGPYAAAGELPVVGGRICGEGVGNGGKDGTRKAVDGSPKGSCKSFGPEGGQDGNKQADGCVGEKKTCGKKSSGMDREALKPRAYCGEKSKDSASKDRWPGDVHRVEVAKGLGQRQISRRKKLDGKG